MTPSSSLARSLLYVSEEIFRFLFGDELSMAATTVLKVLGERPLSPVTRGPLTAWNDANVTFAFEDSEPNVTYFCHVSVKTDVLENVVLAEAIAGRNGLIELAVPDDHITASLDQKAERMGAARPVRQDTMHDHQHKAPAECRKEGRRAVHGASQHRR